MRTWMTQTTVAGLPDEVLALLTEPEAIARWAPLPFEVTELDTKRLVAGSRARVRGGLAGRSLEFEYVVTPVDSGSEVRASVSVSGSGLMGRVLAQATDAVLAAGALNTAVGRIGREFEPALAA